MPYWMQRAGFVTSIENNRQWFEAMASMKNEKVKSILDETDGFPFRIRKESVRLGRAIRQTVIRR